MKFARSHISRARIGVGEVCSTFAGVSTLARRSASRERARVFFDGGT
jgi:hypothetical protein